MSRNQKVHPSKRENADWFAGHEQLRGSQCLEESNEFSNMAWVSTKSARPSNDPSDEGEP